MTHPTPRVPKYRHHKATGQGVVTLGGRDFYLGKFGTRASRDAYARAVGQWLAGGTVPRPTSTSAKPDAFTVVELIAHFMRWATEYYRRPDGSPSTELKNYREALTPLRRLYGSTAAGEFGPLALKTVRGEMIRAGWCRSNINKNIRRVKSAFRWATENELIPPAVHQALDAVAGLKAGRSEAPESKPVLPIGEDHALAVADAANRHIGAMIRLQLLTGMRPGEVCRMRGVDLDTSAEVWTYTPAQHKTAHHGHTRVIYFGPKAQDVLRPFLRPDVNAYLFRPVDVVDERRAARRRARVTPLSCGNGPGSNMKRRPRKVPGEFYETTAYCRAVYTACDKAFPPPAHLTAPADGTPELLAELQAWRREHRFHPNQLRHTAATKLRRSHGLEAAQVILGHKTLTVTQVYAESDNAAALKIVSAVG